jgi:signal transduction histidine kinase
VKRSLNPENKSKSIQMLVFVLNDITNIVELQKLAFKKQNLFFSQVTHELRTPMNSIIPLSEGLKPYLA